MTREYKMAQEVSIPADVLDQIAKDVTEFNRQQEPDFRTMQLISKIFNILDKGVQVELQSDLNSTLRGIWREIIRCADALEVAMLAESFDSGDLRPNIKAGAYIEAVRERWAKPTT